MPATTARHTFCWMDLKVRDPARLEAFLDPVLDWSFAVDEADWRRATVISTGTGGHRLGSVSDLSAPIYPPDVVAHAAFYLSVTDVEASRDTAVELGAEVVVDVFALGSVGRLATLTDPWGAAVTLWQRGEFASWSFPAGTPGAPGAMVLTTPNPARARDFYTRVVGAELRGVEFVAADGEGGAVPRWEAVIGVRRPDLVVERARRYGGRVMPVSRAGGTVSADPAALPAEGGDLRLVGPEGLSVRLRPL